MKKSILMEVNENAKVLQCGLDYFDLIKVIGENFTIAPITPVIHLHDFEEVPEGDYRYCMIMEEPGSYSNSKVNFKVNRGDGIAHEIKGNVIFAKMKEPKDLNDFNLEDLEGMCAREMNAFFNWLGLHFMFTEKGNEILDLRSLMEFIQTMADNDMDVYDKETVYV